MGDPGDHTDAELLVAAREDVEAFATFYRRHVEGILRYFARRTRDPELTADLTAEVFAQALGSLHRYEPRGVPAEAWLYAIARHVLSASIRRGGADRRASRRLRLERPPLDDEERRRLDELGRQPGDGDLVDLLRELPLDQRAAVVARVIEQRPYPAIAAELGCSEAVVRKRVSRGLATLRRRVPRTALLVEDLA